MGGKLRVFGTGRGRPGGSVDVGVDIDLDLVVVSIISAYFHHHHNNQGYVGISTALSVKHTYVLFGKYIKMLIKYFISLWVFPIPLALQ